MIRLGLRLTLNGGKEAAVRLAVTAAAVALGVALLLMALAGMNGLNAQNARSAWLNTGNVGPSAPPPGVQAGPGGPGSPPGSSPGPDAADPLWWMHTTDHFGSQTIDRVDVAATGADSPVPPGMAHLPGPGEFYASPALTRLLALTPASELADRFTGREIGTIGPSALPSPDSLIVVIGHTASQLSRDPRAAPVTFMNTDTRVDGSNGWDASKLEVILAAGVLALLFPVLILIGTATRLSAARREQRFAAMRLVGATPQQISVISAIEASISALVGVAAGFGLFFLLRPAAVRVDFTGQRFFSGDLSLHPIDVLLVVIGVPVAAALAARVAMRRVYISPLGVSRRVTPPTPRVYRLVPLLAGIAELSYFVGVGRPRSTGGQILAYFSGCLLIMVGLVVAGPWLTMMASKLAAAHARRPAALLSARRLSDNPAGSFRAISGLIIALFVSSVSVGVITTVDDYQGNAVGGGRGANGTLVQTFSSGPTSAGIPIMHIASLPVGLSSGLGTMAGVEGVAVLHADPQTAEQPDGPMLVSCEQLGLTPAIGRCPAGAQVAAVTGGLDSHGPTFKSTLSSAVWPAAHISVQQLQELPIAGIAVSTNGTRSAVERARSALEVAMPTQSPPSTLTEINANVDRTVAELKQLTNVVILAALVVAGCSLAVSVTGGVNDRKRPFSLLRLTGVPLKVLRRVVALEAAAPLLVTAVVSAAMGFLAAALFLRSQLDETLRPPSAGYWVLVLVGLAASLGIIACTLPLVELITGPETARNE